MGMNNILDSKKILDWHQLPDLQRKRIQDTPIQRYIDSMALGFYIGNKLITIDWRDGCSHNDIPPPPPVYHMDVVTERASQSKGKLR